MNGAHSSSKLKNAKAVSSASRARAFSGGVGRLDPVVRSAALALLTYALGLIPFYFLTPVHEALPALLGGAPPPTVTATRQPTPAASPTLGVSVPPVAVPAGASTPQLATPRTAVASPPAPPVEDSRYAFLLLGYGGAGHEGAYLTDSIMVVIVQPAQKSLTLLSIPRDIWAPLSLDGQNTFYNKINTAYALAQDPTLYPDRPMDYTGAHGAGRFASESVSHLIGLPIRYYVGLDFQGFRQMIDAVGGIDVDVPVAFAALYPANDDPSIDASWTTVRFAKGQQHMGGERAIQYARAREAIDDSGEGTDYARSRRQRLILEAFKARLFAPGGVIQIPRLLSIASQHLDTDYGIPDVPALGQLLIDWQNVRIYQTALSADNFLEPATGPQNSFALVPSEDGHSWAQIQAFAQHLWDDPPLGVAIANSTIVIENDTGLAGAAGRLSAQLATRGYRVGAPVSGLPRDRSMIVDQTDGGSPLLLAGLSNELGLGAVETEADWRPGGSTIVIKLGRKDLDQIDLAGPDVGDVPRSVFGIETFGSWSPVIDTPTPTPYPSATPIRVQTATPAPEEGAAGAAGRLGSPTPGRLVPSATATVMIAAATPTEKRASATATPKRVVATATPMAATATHRVVAATPTPKIATLTPTPRPPIATHTPRAAAKTPTPKAAAATATPKVAPATATAET